MRFFGDLIQLAELDECSRIFGSSDFSEIFGTSRAFGKLDASIRDTLCVNCIAYSLAFALEFQSHHVFDHCMHLTTARFM